MTICFLSGVGKSGTYQNTIKCAIYNLIITYNINKYKYFIWSNFNTVFITLSFMSCNRTHHNSDSLAEPVSLQQDRFSRGWWERRWNWGHMPYVQSTTQTCFGGCHCRKSLKHVRMLELEAWKDFVLFKEELVSYQMFLVFRCETHSARLPVVICLSYSLKIRCICCESTVNVNLTGILQLNVTTLLRNN